MPKIYLIVVFFLPLWVTGSQLIKVCEEILPHCVNMHYYKDCRDFVFQPRCVDKQTQANICEDIYEFACGKQGEDVIGREVIVKATLERMEKVLAKNVGMGNDADFVYQQCLTSIDEEWGRAPLSEFKFYRTFHDLPEKCTFFVCIILLPESCNELLYKDTEKMREEAGELATVIKSRLIELTLHNPLFGTSSSATETKKKLAALLEKTVVSFGPQRVPDGPWSKINFQYLNTRDFNDVIRRVQLSRPLSRRGLHNYYGLAHIIVPPAAAVPFVTLGEVLTYNHPLQDNSITYAQLGLTIARHFARWFVHYAYRLDDGVNEVIYRFTAFAFCNCKGERTTPRTDSMGNYIGNTELIEEFIALEILSSLIAGFGDSGSSSHGLSRSHWVWLFLQKKRFNKDPFPTKDAESYQEMKTFFIFAAKTYCGSSLKDKIKMTIGANKVFLKAFNCKPKEVRCRLFSEDVNYLLETEIDSAKLFKFLFDKDLIPEFQPDEDFVIKWMKNGIHGKDCTPSSVAEVK